MAGYNIENEFVYYPYPERWDGSTGYKSLVLWFM